MAAALTFTALRPEGGEERVLIPIIQCGDAVRYTIPSFPVLTVNLRRIKYQGYLPDGTLRVVDGFIREHTSLQEHTYPSQIVVTLSRTSSCFVEVCIYVSMDASVRFGCRCRLPKLAKLSM